MKYINPNKNGDWCFKKQGRWVNECETNQGNRKGNSFDFSLDWSRFSLTTPTTRGHPRTHMSGRLAEASGVLQKHDHLHETSPFLIFTRNLRERERTCRLAKTNLSRKFGPCFPHFVPALHRHLQISRFRLIKEF